MTKRILSALSFVLALAGCGSDGWRCDVSSAPGVFGDVCACNRGFAGQSGNDTTCTASYACCVSMHLDSRGEQCTCWSTLPSALTCEAMVRAHPSNRRVDSCPVSP